MSIFYNKVERANPQNRTVPKKWYPSLKTIAQVGEKEVACQISDETTLNPKEVEMVLDQFRKVLVRNLLDSKSVQLGDWGAFHLTCSGDGSDTRAEVSGAKIKKLNVHFTLGKSIRSTVSDYSNEYQNFVSLVSLFSQKREQVLHVEKLENRKGNEGQTVEELLEILDLKDVVFTLDALHCKKNAQQNRNKRQSLFSESQGQSAQTQSGD